MGATAYRLIEQIRFLPGECVVELGSERGEGSTYYFVEHCGSHGIPFYTIDPDKNEAYATAAQIAPNQAYCMTGERFLAEVFPTFDLKIKFAYLDNFDWAWESWGDNHPSFEYLKSIYSNFGLEFSNRNSQKAHLEQAQLVDRHAAPGCVILIDDTWGRPDGAWSGKGGTAVPWLLGHGYALMHQPVVSEGDPPGECGYVAAQRTQ
jgi:hypothetical protein